MKTRLRIHSNFFAVIPSRRAIQKEGNRIIFYCGIQNPGLWNPKYSLRNPESHKRLESVIEVPLTRMHYLESESTAWNQHPRLSWIPLRGEGGGGENLVISLRRCAGRQRNFTKKCAARA